MSKKEISLEDIEQEAKYIASTGLRTIVTGRQAIRLWRRLGGRVERDVSFAFLDRVETERYAPEIPYGTLLLCIDHSCHLDDGDLCILLASDGAATLRYYAVDDRGDQQFVAPGDPGDILSDFDDSDSRTYCGMLLIDAQGRGAYRPANRYARVGYELLGERARVKG